ncbi:MAG: threonylcarbamoyl-AMP synthase [Chitinophagaceae bacterium]|nr:threonylcarbamoyl-AMP synthase [Chitinophagaceae bacterium]
MASFEEDIDHCLTVLRQGGLILYPTDTVWGIGCDATDPQAVEKIYQLKDRSAAKAMIALVADEKDILQYVANPDPGVFDYLKKSVKPTTVIYQGAIGLADNLVHEDGSIAIRIVREKFCRNLLKRFRKPIVSTSANISGEPSPAKFSEIFNHIRTGVDYVVHYRQEEDAPALPSSLIKWNNDGPPVIIRP